MRARDVARNGEAQPGAALILVARVVKPQERLEHLFAQMRSDTGTVIVDGDGQPAVVAMTGNRDRRRVAGGIGDKIGETAFERRRSHRDDRMTMKVHAGPVAVALG